MKEVIQEKLKQFRNLLDSILAHASEKQKRYANKLLVDIMDELNIEEIKIENLREKLSGFDKSEYQDVLIKCIRILQCLGFTQVDLEIIKKGAVELIINERYNDKKELVARDLVKISQMYVLYKSEFEREPQTLSELNKILEQ